MKKTKIKTLNLPEDLTELEPATLDDFEPLLLSEQKPKGESFLPEVRIETVVGPQGEKGDSIIGLPGKDGTDGTNGLDGTNGESVTGPQGPQGIPGQSIVGPKGEDGKSIVGPKGEDGKDGTDGKSIVGPKGEDGKDGIDGDSIVGPKGDKGDIGLTPKHEWSGNKLRFENEIGWGKWVELKGSHVLYGSSSNSGGGSGATDHTLLTNIGTNTHAQVDSHIASTVNPHTVTKAQVGLANVDNTSDVNKPVSTATQTALNLKQDLLDGNLGFSSVLGTSASGDVINIPGLTTNTYNGLQQNITYEPNNLAGGFSINDTNTNIAPLQNSPNESVNILYRNVALDSNSSGFNFGTNGNAARMLALNFNHAGTGNIGEINFLNNTFNIGNGVDPIDVRGMSYAYGYGQFNANVNINGPLLGYGFQPSIAAAATIDTNTYITAFYDNANIDCESPGHTSANFSPDIAEMATARNFTGVNINPNIPVLNGNAGVIGVNISGQFGAFNSGGYYQGVNIYPNISSAQYAAGINVSMDNVTAYPGVQASLVFQDLTLTFNDPGNFNDSFTLEYTSGATAGAEVLSIVGFAIQVQIESGVSTATQVRAAMQSNFGFNAAVTVVISGVGSTAQVTAGPTNFSGGINAGRVLAAFLDGDVEITGGLSFSGALGVGRVSAFDSAPLINSGGTPSSIHSLISSATVAANVTLASADTIGVNTAMLLNIGDNATITTSFLGIAAMASPLVITMGSGSTLDRAIAGAFVFSLDAASTGGTIATVDLCRALALPNGVTAVTKLRGYTMDLPFGDPGTTTWGFYESPGVNNYFQGNLLIGGTAGSDDTVTNASVALEIKSTTKAFVLSRMTTAQKNALTAIEGMYVYDLTLQAPSYYNGTIWS